MAIALQALTAAEDAHTAAETVVDAMIQHWDTHTRTERAAAIAADDAATDAAVLYDNAATEWEAATAAAAVAAYCEHLAL